MVKVKTFWDDDWNILDREVNEYIADVLNHGGKVVDIKFSSDNAGASYSIIAEVPDEKR